MEKELTFVDFGANGEGIAKENGKVYFADFVLPEEKAICDIVEDKGKFAVAKCVKLLTKTDKRIEPKCKYFGVCGGCAVQHLKYEETLKFKKQKVQNCLKKYAKIEPIVNDVITANSYCYRNKIVFRVDYSNGIKLCLVKRKSKELVSIERCEIIDEHINDMMDNIINFLTESRLFVEYVVIRYVSEISIVFVVKRHQKFDTNLVEKYFSNCNVFWSDFDKVNILKGKCNLICGKEISEFEFDGIKANIRPNSFLQVNANCEKLLYKEVINNINSEIVINAYSGSGVLSAILAKNAKQVYGIEIEKSSTIDANKLVSDNGIKNLINICGDCKIEIPKLVCKYSNLTMVVDPPQAGIDKSLCELFNESENIKSVVYVSCNPATLARDLNLLKCFKVVKVQPFDMFPQTAEVETLVILERI